MSALNLYFVPNVSKERGFVFYWHVGKLYHRCCIQRKMKTRACPTLRSLLLHWVSRWSANV